MSMSLSLKQGKEGSRDGGKPSAHPTWIRSNMRATWGHLSVNCASPEEAANLEGLLQYGTPYGDICSASLTFEMLYEDGEEVELLEKKGGNLADRVKLILPAGNVDQGITMPDTTIAYHTAHGGSRHWVKSTYFQFDATRFPWNSDKKSKMAVEEQESDVMELGLKFATNVTTRAHDKRRFKWRVELTLFDDGGLERSRVVTHTPPFQYLPRNPEKSAQDFRLDEVVSDGRPGDLVMCGGSGLGCKERPGLVARLRGPKGATVTLPRLGAGKSTFTTRLPADLAPGAYYVRLVVEENDEEATEEVKTRVVRAEAEACAELDEFTKQLAAEALSREASGGSHEGSDEEMGAASVSPSPALRSTRSHRSQSPAEANCFGLVEWVH